MARVRSIHPGAPQDEEVAALSLAARYVWAFLPCHADREGRLKDSAFTIKSQILPGDAIDMEAVLAELASAGFITRYQVDGKRYIQVRSFLRYQSPHTREISSVIPPVPTKAVTEHGEGDALARDGLAGVSHGPSSPDPDPGPGAGPERAPAIPVAPATEPVLWPPFVWLAKFKAHWDPKYGGFYGQAGDSKACGTLGDLLARLPDDERLRVQSRAPGMIAAFLAGGGENARARKHPFAFFVGDFGTLRMESRTQRDSVLDAAAAKSGGLPYLPPERKVANGS